MKLKSTFILAFTIMLLFTVHANCFELDDAIPPSVASRLPDEITDIDSVGTDSLSFDYIFGELYSDFLSALSPATVSLSTLLGMLIIAASAKLFCPNKKDSISTASSVIIGIYVVSVEAKTAVNVETFASSASTFVTAITPILSALQFSSGGTLTGTITSASFLFFSAVTEFISTYIFIPIYKASLGFAVIGTVGRGAATHIFKAIKDFFTFALSALAVVYIAVLSYQTSLAAATDTVAARSLKFALSSSVPIVGSALGDAVRTTASGLSVIKSSSGALGIVVMFLLTSPVLTRLLLSSAVYSVLSVAAKLIGCDTESEIFDEMKNAVRFAIATLSIICVVFIISTAIFIKTTPYLTS